MEKPYPAMRSTIAEFSFPKRQQWNETLRNELQCCEQAFFMSWQSEQIRILKRLLKNTPSQPADQTTDDSTSRELWQSWLNTLTEKAQELPSVSAPLTNPRIFDRLSRQYLARQLEKPFIEN